jgi:hypothetical protein
MRDEDVVAVNEMSAAAFEHYARRRGEPLPPRQPVEGAHVRLRHLLAYPDRGYVAHRGGTVKMLAASDDEAAAALLRTALAGSPATGTAEVDNITAAQQWAIDVALATELMLESHAAVFLRADVGPFRPYLTGRAYL